MSEKLFTVVGESINNNTHSYRVANNINRAKVLARNGHTDITLIQLPYAMTKDDAITYYKNSTKQATSAYRDSKGRFTKQAFRFAA